jgi:hypothetical protein
MSENGFKKKTIRKVLKAKISNWLSSITDESVKVLLKDNVIVTGGSIVSMLMGDEIKDFDIYFKTKGATLAAANYYCEVFAEQNSNSQLAPVAKLDDTGRISISLGGAGIAEADDAAESQEQAYEDNLGEGRSDKVFVAKDKEESDTKPKYRPIFLSENAITLTNKIQLIIRFYGSAEEIRKNYDYEHCKNVYDYSKDELTLLPSALESILSKTLIYTGSLYPICSLFRMRKFIERGWRISAGEIVKMSFQISELNLKDMNVLREQLTGCDAMYMRSLMIALKESERNIDSIYMMEIIDKVFNQ